MKEKIEEGNLPLFPIDATPSDLARARKAREAALSAVAPAAALCDLVTAARLAGEPLPVDVSR